MRRASTYAAGQARLARRLFCASVILNILLATGIMAAGCYGILFNPTGYIAVDSNLHFSALESIPGRSGMKLVDNIYTGKADGHLLEEQGSEESGTEKAGSEKAAEGKES